MIRALLGLLLAGAAGPALAQHAGHEAPRPQLPADSSTCTPEHAAMGHCELPAAPRPTSPEPEAASCTPEHAAMGHCKLPEATVPTPRESAPSCPPEHAAMGHCTPEQPATAADTHAAHQTGAQADPYGGHRPSTATPPAAPPPPAALTGPAHAADLIFGAAVMREAREELLHEHGRTLASKILIDRLEARSGQGGGTSLDAEAWYGGDINKLWLKTEVEGEGGRTPDLAELQALWSRAVDPWFDFQAGVRYDANKGVDRGHLVLGVQGLAPYWWEVEGAVFLSHKGEVTARAEAEYDLRITQRLILQPSLEIDLSAQDVEELGIGAGLTSAELGLRLRYQVSQQFAPYLGLSYERAFGRTRGYRRTEEESTGGPSFVGGLRLWF